MSADLISVITINLDFNKFLDECSGFIKNLFLCSETYQTNDKHVHKYSNEFNLVLVPFRLGFSFNFSAMNFCRKFILNFVSSFGSASEM